MPHKRQERINKIMIKVQENKFTMAKGIINYLSENQQIISSIPELIQNLNQLNQKSDEIESKDTERKTIRKGKLNVKYSDKSKVTVKAFGVMGALNAYAVKSGLVELKNHTMLNRSALEKMRDTELIGRLNFIRELAQENLQALEGFGITQDKFEAFSQSVDKYENSVGQSESSKAIQKGAKKTLEELFRELDLLLSSTDRLTDGLMEENPEFVRNYRLARKIYNPGMRHRIMQNTSAGNTTPAVMIQDNGDKESGTS